jgi:pimeloyl-ACP methyl ester carboxylesterase
MLKRIKSLILSIAVACGLYNVDTSPVHAAKGEQVILLHGIARSSNHMDDLEQYLEAKGYQVFNLDYPSTEHELEKLTAIVAEDIRNTISASKPVHFVGYSMGGIVTRAILNKYRPDNLGRVVQLASPNKGSEVADFLQNNWLYEKVYGPAGKQLVTQDAGIDDLLGIVNYEMGVIAGNFSIDPISSSLIEGDDDGKVSVESTRVKGMKDHIILNASHTFFPQNEEVHKQTLHFLRTGFFDRSQ